jgi:putative ABC transport system permease protein
VLAIPVGRTTKQNVDVFRNEILRSPDVLNAGTSDYIPYSSTNWTRISWEGATGGQYLKINVNYVDENVIPTYGMSIVEGQGFSEEFRVLEETVVILNQTAARKIGWADPVGKRILYNVDYRFRRVGGARVVGIVEDYHFLSLHHTITPLMMRLYPKGSYGSNISIKISGRNVPETIGFIQSRFKEIFPEKIFAYRFLDEDFQQMYLEEQKAGKVIFYLAALAIAIACMGLFGLASFATKQRTKEIGIRKVVGASVSTVVLLLTKEFVKLMALANLLAWPVAYFSMQKWLQNFPYRVGIQWWVFMAAGTAALLAALATVSYQSAKAALANPADSLRHE